MLIIPRMSVTVTMDSSPGCSLTVVTQRVKKPHRGRLFYSIRLASESSKNSEDESVCSLQAEQTEYVSDTTETDRRSSPSDEEELNESHEYELAASSESSERIEFSSTDSETKRIITRSVVTSPLMELVKTESSDVESISPEEFARNTVPRLFELCMGCKGMRCYPLLKFCRKCYKDRRRHVPPRVRKRRKKLSKSDLKGKTRKVDPQVSARKLIAQKELEITQACDRLKSGLQNAGASASSTSNASSSSTSGYSSLTQSSGIFSGPSTSKSTASDSDEDEDQHLPVSTKDMCVICERAPKDCAFLHQTVAHRCCCYSCAKYISETSRRCPTCNRMVNRIVRLYSS